MYVFACRYCYETNEVLRKCDLRVFCDSSCAAKFNSKLRSEESKQKQRITVKATTDKKGLDGATSYKTSPYPKTPITLSRITGLYYNSVIHDNTWHENTKTVTAKRLAKMFNFKLGVPQALLDIENAIVELHHLYHVKRMSGADISKMFNFPAPNFTDWLVKCCGLKLKRMEDAKEFDYRAYRRQARFIFKASDYTKIKGIYLIGDQRHMSFKGFSKDHMFSVKQGYIEGISPTIIGHPANCQILTTLQNSSKGKKCSITLNELMERIKNWK